MVEIHHKTAKSILSKASGFASSFDFTLNPYSGCAFGCTYCYAAFFAPTDALQESWGKWVAVKENALELLRKRRKTPLTHRTIYMSTVTDPYQHVEKRLELTRAILRELIDHHQPRLMIQTRSPLVTRDIHLLREFTHVRVNMTVTTDDEDIRRAFEPTCPPNRQRLDAIREIAAAGVDTCVTMTPLLPVRNPENFARDLLSVGAQRYVVQQFHTHQRRFAAGTGDKARALLAERGWSAADYAHVKAVLAAHLPNLYEGKAGFAPSWT
ncbi:MAG: radical SAM protein [bacterium]|nr:radical SAM protein [bacterium]